MSDFMYEFEDNVWDEFGTTATDDHIVPRTVDEYGDQCKAQGVGQTKPPHEVTGVASNADNMTKHGIFGEKGKGFHSLTKNRMLERGSWAHSPDGIFPTSGDDDSLKEVTSMCSDDPMMSNHGLKTGDMDPVSSDFCAGDPVLVGNCATEDNNIYRFSLNHISEANNDLRFFSNNHEDKENSDLLSYGWGDIGNFEDVDRMFRSCDSTFGLGSLCNEDDMCWISSSQATEGSQDVLKSDAKLISLPEQCVAYRPENSGPSTIDSYNRSVPSDKISSLDMSGDKSGLADLSSLNVSNKESETKDDLTPNEQITPQKRKSKQRNAAGGKIDHNLENGGSCHQYGNIKQFADVTHPYTDSPCQLVSPVDRQRHKENIGPDSVSYVQTNVPHMDPSDSSPTNQISRCSTLSGTKSEKKGHASLTNGSSFASNKAQSIERSRGHSFEVPDIITNEKRGKLYHQQDTQAPLNRNVNQARGESQIAFYDPLTVQKQVRQSEQDEAHSEVDGFSVGKQPELDSSNGQDSLCVSSMLHEVSLEATSFRQLQQVMEKLDIRTKLCIRDSLYRLARSAEQRHNCSDMKSGNGDDKDASGPLVAEETNKCTRFMDIETDTNPIDRSIAHLLFHRPSDPSSRRPATDTSSVKPHGMIHGPTTAPPVAAGKQIGDEETGAGSDKERLLS